MFVSGDIYYFVKFANIGYLAKIKIFLKFYDFYLHLYFKFQVKWIVGSGVIKNSPPNSSILRLGGLCV